MQKITFYCGGTDKQGRPVTSGTYADVLKRNKVDFTLFQGVGVWEGGQETSYVFVVFNDNLFGAEVEALARGMARAGGQSCVLASIEIVEAKFIFA
jgi:hypothetical protein